MFEKICIILNLQIKLFQEFEADCYHNNLSTANEITIIIPDKYN